MKLVADKNGRICSAELFPPRTAFDASRQPDGSIRVVELMEKEVPVVKPVRTREGFLMVPVEISRKLIRAALRADRSDLTKGATKRRWWPEVVARIDGANCSWRFI